jgi:hypothetical protein
MHQIALGRFRRRASASELLAQAISGSHHTGIGPLDIGSGGNTDPAIFEPAVHHLLAFLELQTKVLPIGLVLAMAGAVNVLTQSGRQPLQFTSLGHMASGLLIVSKQLPHRSNGYTRKDRTESDDHHHLDERRAATVCPSSAKPETVCSIPFGQVPCPELPCFGGNVIHGSVSSGW